MGMKTNIPFIEHWTLEGITNTQDTNTICSLKWPNRIKMFHMEREEKLHLMIKY